MTTELKQELQTKGIKLVPLWQFVWIIIVAIITIGITYGSAINRIDSLEVKVRGLEDYRARHQAEVTEIRISLENRLTSIEAKLDYLIRKGR